MEHNNRNNPKRCSMLGFHPAHGIAQLDFVLISLVSEAELTIRRLAFFELLELSERPQIEVQECSLKARRQLLRIGEIKSQLICNPSNQLPIEVVREIFVNTQQIVEQLLPHLISALHCYEDSFCDDDLTDEIARESAADFHRGLKQAVALVESTEKQLQALGEQLCV